MNRDHAAISVVKQKKKEIKWIIKNHLGSLLLLCGTEVNSKSIFVLLYQQAVYDVIIQQGKGDEEPLNYIEFRLYI